MATLMYSLASSVVIKHVLIVNVMHRIPEALENNAHWYEVRTCQVYYVTRWNLKTDWCLTLRHLIQTNQH